MAAENRDSGPTFCPRVFESYPYLTCALRGRTINHPLHQFQSRLAPACLLWMSQANASCMGAVQRG